MSSSIALYILRQLRGSADSPAAFPQRITVFALSSRVKNSVSSVEIISSTLAIIPVPIRPFERIPERGPSMVAPRRLRAVTLSWVVILFHILVLQAGHKITGFRWYCHATNTELRRLSATPFAILPIELQETGATTTQSAQSQSAKWAARTGIPNSV